MKCSYGCGKEGNYQFKNGKLCCSRYPSQCSIVRKKNSDSKIGINPWKNRKHPMKGKVHPMKGKRLPKSYKYNWKKIQKYYNDEHTIRECYKKFGVSLGAIRKAYLRGDIITRNRSDSTKLAILKGRNHTATSNGWTDDMKKRLSAVAKKRNLGGNNPSCKIKYNGIKLDSSYELKYAKYLDSKKIKWIRPNYFIWIDKKNNNHRYYPDFYLINEDKYIDTKNEYLIKKHENKIQRVIEQNNINLEIISKDDLDKLGS